MTDPILTPAQYVAALLERDNEITRLKDRVAFIDEGLPQNIDLEGDFVWAMSELTRRKAYAKADIARMLGALHRENTQLRKDVAAANKGAKINALALRESTERNLRLMDEIKRANEEERSRDVKIAEQALRIARLSGALSRAADTFELYARMHASKEPPQHDKAQANLVMCNRCRDAIAT